MMTPLRSAASAAFAAVALVAAASPAGAAMSTEPLTTQTVSTEEAGGNGQGLSSGAATQSSDGAPVCTSSKSTDGGFYFGLDCERQYGSSEWGAGYDLHGSITADTAKLRINADLGTHVTAFGENLSIVDADVVGSSKADSTVSGQAHLYILGVALYSDSFSGRMSFTPSTTQRFFKVSAAFPIGGLFTARLTGGVEGTAGVTLSGTLTSTVTGTFAPSAGLNAFVSASVGVLDGAVAEVGFEVSLTMVEVSAPIVLSVGPTTQARMFKYTLEGDLVIKSLSGQLKIFWNAIFGLIGDEYVVTSWKGVKKTIDLITKTSSFTL